MNCQESRVYRPFSQYNFDKEMQRRKAVLRLLWLNSEFITGVNVPRYEPHPASELTEMMGMRVPNQNIENDFSISASMTHELIRMKAQEFSYHLRFGLPFRRNLQPPYLSETLVQTPKSENLPIQVTNAEEIPGSKGARDAKYKFPYKLHQLISNPEYHEYITWLPHGRAWKILKRKQFERVAIPRHFKHGKLSSFMRQVRLEIFISFWIETNVNIFLTSIFHCILDDKIHFR
jgi:HSF-type DNA-binding